MLNKSKLSDQPGPVMLRPGGGPAAQTKTSLEEFLGVTWSYTFTPSLMFVMGTETAVVFLVWLVNDGNAQTGRWLFLTGNRNNIYWQSASLSIFSRISIILLLILLVSFKFHFASFCFSVWRFSSHLVFVVSLFWLFVWFVPPARGSPAPPCVVQPACFLFLPPLYFLPLCLDSARFFFWLDCRWTVLVFVSRQPKEGSLSFDWINLGRCACI